MRRAARAPRAVAARAAPPPPPRADPRRCGWRRCRARGRSGTPPRRPADSESSVPAPAGRRRARAAWRTRGSSRLSALSLEVGQGGEELGVVLGVLEIAEDRGKPRGRQRVEAHQLVHHALAEPGALDLLLPEVLDRALQAVDQLLEVVRRDRPLLAGLADRRDQLLALELLAPPVLLDHLGQDFLDALAGGEPATALEAFAAAPDLGPVAAQPGVDHLVHRVAAVGTAHGSGDVVPAAWIQREASAEQLDVLADGIGGFDVVGALQRR